MSDSLLQRGKLAILLAATAAICTVAAARMWPVIDGDGLFFIPPAVEWSEGHQLTNPAWPAPLTDAVDAQHRYVYHGFLFPMAVGELGRLFGGGPRAVVAAVYVLHWLAAWLATFAVWRWSGTRSALVPFAMLGICIAWHGRVEPLAILLVAVACLSWRRSGVAVGACLGLLFFTSPACGAIGAAMLTAGIVLERTNPLPFAVGTLASSAAAVAWYPFTISDWVRGMLVHGRIVNQRLYWQGFAPTWLTRPELPLLAITIGLLAAGALAQLHQSTRALPAIRQAALWTCVAVVLLGLGQIAIRRSEASYNAVVWIPLLVSLTAKRRQLIAIALVLPALGLARSVLTMTNGTVPFEAAQQRLAAADGCTVSSGLWLASRHAPIGATPTGNCFVKQETYSGSSAPPTYAGYELVENTFAAARSPLQRTAGGWEFAVYRRKDGQRAP